jgi:DNA-binding NtrC family response regulator
MAQLKIFYIDDEPDLCAIFSDVFSTHDVQIITFSDWKVAIEEHKKNPPDLIFIDFRLPSTTGDNVARNMGGTIPKYLITGDSVIKSDFQFQKIFEKPFDIDAIRAVIDQALAQKTE